MKNTPLFELTSENLSNVGGPMGTDYTTTNFRKFYPSAEAAKSAAEKDYGRPIKWAKKGKHGWTSGDLNYVMYDIVPVRVERP